MLCGHPGTTPREGKCDRGKITVEAAILTDGDDYFWKIKTYDNEHIGRARLRVLEGVHARKRPQSLYYIYDEPASGG